MMGLQGKMHVISLLWHIRILFVCIYVTLQECVLVHVCEEYQEDGVREEERLSISA